METVVLVHLFTNCGGGERLSLEMASALSDAGYNVIYVTNSSKCLKECGELFGLPHHYRVIERVSILEKALSITGRFVRFRRLMLFRKLFDVVREINGGFVVDTVTNIPSNVDVAYIHYPATLGTIRSGDIRRKLYNWLVGVTTKPLIGRPRKVLTNSSWTAKLIKEVFGLNADILYPPVDVDYFAYDGRVKEKVIVTVSRLTSEKNLHLLPRVASKLPDYEWYLVGSAGLTSIEKTFSTMVLDRVLNEVRKQGARNFHIIINASRSRLRDLLQSATYYVHPQFAEHFGIAVVEAMAAGCIPIVYRVGGAWTDIVSPINESLGYNSVDEIPAILKSLGALERSKIMDVVIRHSMRFSRKNFRSKFLEVIGSA